jgi:hypothetical protein
LMSSISSGVRVSVVEDAGAEAGGGTSGGTGSSWDS